MSPSVQVVEEVRLPTREEVLDFIIKNGANHPDVIDPPKFAQICGYSRQTGWRKFLRPFALPDGTSVRLPCVRVSTRWCTTLAAVRAYLLLISAVPEGANTPAEVIRSTAKRTAATDRANRELAKAGI
jgi:hypothetical protein